LRRRIHFVLALAPTAPSFGYRRGLLKRCLIREPGLMPLFESNQRKKTAA
jgi:hypothetical protein